MNQNSNKTHGATMVPTSDLIHLNVGQLRPSPHNPRKLFDPEPLAALKKSIRDHGVLVPLTVFPLPGQDIYAIVDGERRYKCCCDLKDDNIDVIIPANVVAPPDPTASLIYMFNIHQFRQQWELMPTAIALQSVIQKLKIDDPRELTELTGLSAPQVERCKTILSFPERYQRMSMDVDPKKRIPSNFWIELHPVLDLAETLTPDLYAEQGRNKLTDLLIQKYRKGRIKSVIHFRRILEAFDVQEDDEQGVQEVAGQLRAFFLTPEMETRQAFDEFIADPRRIQRASQAADRFINELKKAKIDHATDKKEELIQKLVIVRQYVDDLLAKLEGEDQPQEEDS